MGAAFAAPIANAAIAKTTSFIQAEQARAQKLNQASDREDQADALRQQARQQRALGERQAYDIDKQKSAIRRDYDEVQGRNRAMLGAGNVDVASGSAAQVAEGNANRFAAAMGENAFKRAMKLWETNEQEKQTRSQAELYDAQASSMKKTAGNLLTSWLLSDLAGASAFFGGGGASAIQGLVNKNSVTQQDLNRFRAQNPQLDEQIWQNFYGSGGSAGGSFGGFTGP